MAKNESWGNKLVYSQNGILFNNLKCNTASHNNTEKSHNTEQKKPNP